MKYLLTCLIQHLWGYVVSTKHDELDELDETWWDDHCSSRLHETCRDLHWGVNEFNQTFHQVRWSSFTPQRRFRQVWWEVSLSSLCLVEETCLNSGVFLQKFILIVWRNTPQTLVWWTSGWTDLTEFGMSFFNQVGWTRHEFINRTVTKVWSIFVLSER